MPKFTLDVPYFSQPDSSSFCGAATARMVLAYYARRYSLPFLVKSIGISQAHGVETPTLGAWFCERGFEVTIVACPKELPPRLAYLPQEQLVPELRKWATRSVTRQRFVRKAMLRFLDAGGRFEYRPVQWRDISQALERGEPPILNVTMGSYYPTRTWNAGHYVVPTAIDRRELGFHDPIMGPMTLPREQALHVCHFRHGGAIFISRGDRTRP